MPEQRGGDIRWPDMLAALDSMEQRIMAGVRDAATAAHSTSDRLDGRLLEHGAQHARDRNEHLTEHESQWTAHQREHELAAAAAREERRNSESRRFSSLGLWVAGGALLIQTVAFAATLIFK